MLMILDGMTMSLGTSVKSKNLRGERPHTHGTIIAWMLRTSHPLVDFDHLLSVKFL